MTRSWLFTLTDVTKTYNLWYDLIAMIPGFDVSFSNFPCVPSMVQELKVQNQSPGTNINWSNFSLAGAFWDVKRAAVNSIDLKKETLSCDTNPTVAYVTITAN
jgi:hypothetical protein